MIHPSVTLPPLSPAREGHEALCGVIRDANRLDEEAVALLGFARIESPLKKTGVRGTTRYALVEATRIAAKAWAKETADLPRTNVDRIAALQAMELVKKADSLYWSIVLLWAPMGIKEARRAIVRLQIEQGDVEQWAYLGLYAAAVRFDPDKDVLFSTYSKWWVRAWCYRQAQPQGTIVHIPAPARTTAWQIRTISRKGPLPEVEELAEMLQVSVEQVRDAMQALGAQLPWVSIHTPERERDEETSAGMRQFETPEDGDSDADAVDPFVQKRVRKAMEGLKPRERELLCIRYNIDVAGKPDLTLAQIGIRYGLSRERIRQIEREAMGRLKESLAPIYGEPLVVDPAQT